MDSPARLTLSVVKWARTPCVVDVDARGLAVGARLQHLRAAAPRQKFRVELDAIDEIEHLSRPSARTSTDFLTLCMGPLLECDDPESMMAESTVRIGA